MLWSFPLLIGCQLLGELAHRFMGIPIPGTVLGLGLLLGLLGLRRAEKVSLPAADALLPYLGLFFVPPGVAAISRLAYLRGEWSAFAVAILGSSVLTLVVAGRTAQALLVRHKAAAPGLQR